jgi:hypothetical protein
VGTTYEFRIVREPLRINGPVTTITDRPRLGVEVDWALVGGDAAAQEI